MSEEKKAIELLRKLKKKTPYIIWEDGTPYNKSNQIQTVLNLIEKQQKEIEDLKELMAHKNGYTKQLEEDLFENASNYVVSKDKIREKIKEYKGLKEIDKMAYEEQIKPLQELLEEE